MSGSFTVLERVSAGIIIWNEKGAKMKKMYGLQGREHYHSSFKYYEYLSQERQLLVEIS